MRPHDRYSGRSRSPYCTARSTLNVIYRRRRYVQRILQQRLARITVSQMLSQSFGVTETALPAVARAPAPRLFQIFVNAVMGAQPVLLRLMTAQHFELLFKGSGDVYIKVGKDALAHRVNAVDGVGVIQRGRRFRRRRGRDPARLVERDR